MTRPQFQTMRISVLRGPLGLVLLVWIAVAAPAQQGATAQTPVQTSTALTAVPPSVPKRPPLKRLPPSQTIASRMSNSGSSLSFLSALTFDGGETLSGSVAIADLNRDGKPDVVISGSRLSVLLGNGDGTFSQAVLYDSGGLIPSVAVADVNGDSKPDILVANECSYFDGLCRTPVVGVLLGNGDGTFQTVVPYSLGGFDARFIAVADVNGDGKPDLAVVLCSQSGEGECAGMTVTGSVAILLGNGDGTFQPPVSYSTDGYEASSVLVVDLNGDGKPDLAVANECSQVCEFYGEGNVGILLGNGDGTFRSAVTYDSGGSNARTILAADVNGDHKVDLLISNDTSAAVLLGNGDGTFQTALTNASGGGFTEAAVDVNHDGNLDLLFTRFGNIAVFLGNGDGSFQPAQTYVIGVQGLVSVAAADLNGDGWSDIVFVSSYSSAYGTGDGLLGVMLNNTPSALIPTHTLLFSSLNPSFAGQAVTLTTTVSSSSGNPPDGGLVTFYYFGAPGVVGTALLTGGKASVTTSLLPTGTSALNAVYSGDNQYGPSMSPILDQVVNATSKSVTSTTLASSLNPSIYGEKVTWTVKVTTTGSTAPTGKVNLGWNGYSLGSATLNSGGMATLTIAKLNADPYPLTATYKGDMHNLGSTSAVLNQVVTQGTSSATLTSSPNPSTAGQAVTFTATITSPTAKPTGPVTFSAGKAILGTAQLSKGKAIFTTSTLAVGSITVTASYNGDSNIAPSSASVTQVVQ